MFLAQGYRDKELVIVDDGADCVSDLIPHHPQIRYFREEPRRLTLGAKRNLACDLARGELILHWDDDDWYAPWRVAYQAHQMEVNGLDLCGINRAFFVDGQAKQAWEYVQVGRATRWLCGATLGFRKSLWQQNRFANVRVGEDNRFVLSARNAKVAALQNNRFFVCRIHQRNTCTKRPVRWPSRPFEMVQSIVGPDWEEYFGGDRAMPQGEPASRRGAALVSAASGIGDILRVTPLIRAAYRLGYDVDVLLSPDDAAAADLLRGTREIRRLVVTSFPRARSSRTLPELAAETYDIATFTALSAALADRVPARTKVHFARDWRAKGEVHSIERLARSIGWDTELPPPFAVRSSRYFEVPAETIAIHPGCKPNWPWKKWHGFDELANLLGSVAIVGTLLDLENSRTYFERRFSWPESALDFVGKLDLRDTAALLTQCSAVVSPDSGLMHLGVALRVPTFGIFGITSPERECMKSPFMIPVTKRLPCEVACRHIVGRRDCELHLECLATLSPEEVSTAVKAGLAGKAAIEFTASAARKLAVSPQARTARSTQVRPRAAGAPNRKSVAPITKGPCPAYTERRTQRPRQISVNYYCNDFPFASGYGQAARMYVHALHAAGVNVRIGHARAAQPEIRDDLLSSLAGRNPDADFDIFHGIPTNWSHFLPQARYPIIITVWEADHIPHTWRAALSKAKDVWVPSADNVEIFLKSLAFPPFKLPHALPRAQAPPRDPIGHTDANIRSGDFVFYSILKWQDRKNPRGVIEAFLRAFTAESNAVLLLKTNPRAAYEAVAALRELRGKIMSDARVLLRCELFDEARMRALHERGDCYVSLHRGEGFGYPLFEAAALGKPVVATAYGGPVDYLDAKRHWLVDYSVTHIRRPHYLYATSMKWAEPELTHATEGMRWIYEHAGIAREQAALASQNIRARYSLERIGEAAKDRLATLRSS